MYGAVILVYHFVHQHGGQNLKVITTQKILLQSIGFTISYIEFL